MQFSHHSPSTHPLTDLPYRLLCSLTTWLTSHGYFSSTQKTNGKRNLVRPRQVPNLRGQSSSFLANVGNSPCGRKSKLRWSAHDLFLFYRCWPVVDIPWVLRYHHCMYLNLLSPWLFYHSNLPLLVVHGDQRETNLQLRKEAQPYPNIKLFPVSQIHSVTIVLIHFLRPKPPISRQS